MITTFHIKNFKGLRDLSADGVSRLTIITGKNNSGKSSILEALFMFFDRINPEMSLRHFAFRGVSVISPVPNEVWSPLFSNFDIDRKISIAVTDNEKGAETLLVSVDRGYVKGSVGTQGEVISTGTASPTTTAPASLSLAVRIEREGTITQDLHQVIGSRGLAYEGPVPRD